MKLAKELSKRGTGRTLYILDEPTTGLHFEDTRKLLDVLNKLVDQGNTIVVIEHNLDVIKSADYVIDLGPEGGAGGGRIVAAGTPEEVARQRAVGDRTLPGRSACRAERGRSDALGGRSESVVVELPQFWRQRAVVRRTTKPSVPTPSRPCRIASKSLFSQTC